MRIWRCLFQSRPIEPRNYIIKLIKLYLLLQIVRSLTDPTAAGTFPTLPNKTTAITRATIRATARTKATVKATARVLKVIRVNRGVDTTSRALTDLDRTETRIKAMAINKTDMAATTVKVIAIKIKDILKVTIPIDKVKDKVIIRTVKDIRHRIPDIRVVKITRDLRGVELYNRVKGNKSAKKVLGRLKRNVYESDGAG